MTSTTGRIPTPEKAAWRSRIIGHGSEAPDQLLANPRNWRLHPKEQQQALSGLLDQVGWVQDVIVNQRTGHVVDGHLRVSLAISRSEPEIPVVYVDLDEDEEALVLASLDPLAAMAATDKDQLAALMAEVEAGDAALQAMLDDLATAAGVAAVPTPGLTDPDDVPVAPEEPVSKPGDLYLLGEHRLLCGDSTNADDVARLLDGTKPTMMFTDPPYGVAYEGGTKKRDAIANDETCEVAAAALLRAAEALPPGAAAYCCGPAGRNSVAFGAAWMEAGFHFASTIIWVKDNSTFGRADYQWMHEPIIYGWRLGGAHGWFGNRKQTTVWHFPRPPRSEEHPTMKPVELVARAVGNSSPPGTVVYDPFLGSGTTLIAAEQLGRRCYGMEIEPRYVDVIVKRWEDFTGQKAERVDG